VVPVKSLGKRNVLGVLVDAVDYEYVVDEVLSAAEEGRSLAVSALAVHGVMTGVMDVEHRFRLNVLDIVTPDGQPIRWALNRLYGTQLQDRVYGPHIAEMVCGEAARRGFSVYFYGTTPEILDRIAGACRRRFPGLVIAGIEASKFRRTTPEEKREIVERIRSSGAQITFVGLGCPRQEIFAHEYRDSLGMPVIAVGAAFDYLAGVRAEPPPLVQRMGLQWLHRLLQEPRRLWRRYLVLNPLYVMLLMFQGLRLWRPDPSNVRVPQRELMWG
jgi:N-acetylglucosaminyldiphosphoundecaprenol N-acetyl-beta-D-mannosaminyltransferase